MSLKIKIKKLNPSAVIPTKAHDADAGFDLTAISRTTDDHGNWVYDTGIAMSIPEGHVGLLFMRSSVAKKSQILTNAVGVVDSGYLGPITLKMKPIIQDIKYTQARPYEVGERIAQIIILPIPKVEFDITDDLGSSERGTGNYGSSGR